MKQNTSRVNKACRYFPCHIKLEDCIFCYCPFYPCGDSKRGNFIHPRPKSAAFRARQPDFVLAGMQCGRLSIPPVGSIYTRDKRKVWSCQNCNWIHQKSVVDEIFTLIRDRYKPQTIKPKAENSKTGVIILSHGSKLKNANNTMFTIVNTVKKELGLKNILSAYLQFHQPDLAKTVRRLAAKGCKKIIIVPFFLFKGNHVSLDVPKAIKEEKAKHPQVNFIYTHNLGPDTRLSEIVINRISEAIKCTQKK